MKQLLITIIALTIITSCTTEKKSEQTLDITETRGVKSFGTKFINDDSWIILKIDGSYEASFEPDNLEFGNWVLNNETKKLNLTTIKDGDGKGKIKTKQFNVIEFTDDKITLINEQGNKIELKSE